MRLNENGLTLVEVMLVVILLGILAVISIPSVLDNIKSAIKTEAVTAMGVIRTAEKSYYAEYSNYATFSGGAGLDALGLNPNDFNGQYYSGSCYSVYVARFTGRPTIQASPAVSQAPQRQKVTSFGAMYMDIINGNISGDYQ
ncbi:MAG: hypothetical protein A2987_06340 [Omnitrophica bacterium RIFCSPLOWO2_01_FULL_45_10]|nr:MAG: hypothetical protein A2987_06340 [Omnitrophica bacterium RIFCSPLOWO2_01_FULL_45_10]